MTRHLGVPTLRRMPEAPYGSVLVGTVIVFHFPDGTESWEPAPDGGSDEHEPALDLVRRERRAGAFDTAGLDTVTPAAWHIRYGEHGWVRSVHEDRPIITGAEREAFQWSSRGEAQAAVAALPPTRVERWVEPGPAVDRVIHGDPARSSRAKRRHAARWPRRTSWLANLEPSAPRTTEQLPQHRAWADVRGSEVLDRQEHGVGVVKAAARRGFLEGEPRIGPAPAGTRIIIERPERFGIGDIDVAPAPHARCSPSGSHDGASLHPDADNHAPTSCPPAGRRWLGDVRHSSTCGTAQQRSCRHVP